MDGTLKEQPELEAAHPKRASILSQGETSRFDRWIEFLSAVVLSLATVFTAWCGYQATRWSGEQAQSYSVAAARGCSRRNTPARGCYAAASTSACSSSMPQRFQQTIVCCQSFSTNVSRKSCESPPMPGDEAAPE